MIHIEIFRNNKLNHLLNHPRFLEEWQNLASQSPGFHVLQEPSFVKTWYQHYQDRYEPICVLGKERDGTLRGFMALAWDIQHQCLIHAGDTAAEYHGWLVKEGYSEEFFVQSLLALKTHVPVKKWEWNFLPPHLPLKLTQLQENKLYDAGIYMTFREEESPLWDLRDTAKLKKNLKSSSLRSKKNRLKKKGELWFEVIEEEDRARETLRVAAKQCDFRKEAQHGTRPFADAPESIEFNVDLIQNQQCLHCSALWLDDQLLAFHLGASDGKSLHLGLITFDPSAFAFSPGAILFSELAKSLTEAGYETFDITPGGDAYKQRYANSAVRIRKPTIFMNRVEYEKGKLKEKTISSLHNLGLMERCKQLSRAIKQVDIQALLKGPIFQQEKIPKNQLHLLEKIPPLARNRKIKDVRKQHYADLMRYKDNCPYTSRRNLLIQAFEKFKRSEILYSLGGTDELAGFGWMRRLKKDENLCGQELEKGTYILYDFYFQKPERRLENFKLLCKKMLEDVEESACIYLMLKNSESFLLDTSTLQKTEGLALAWA